VVIGKSEWKKLAKWMKEASKDGLLKIKESKGEVTVQRYVITLLALMTVSIQNIRACKLTLRL